MRTTQPRGRARNPPPKKKLELLKSGDLDSKEQDALFLALMRAAERERDRNWRKGEDPAALDVKEREQREAIRAAHALGAEARAARLERELLAVGRKARDERPEHERYEHQVSAQRALRGNPQIPVELGKLTAITWKGGSRRWSLSTAPFLVYDERGRLLIVYASRSVGDATSAETREYARTHWGQRGIGDVRAGDIAKEPFRELGAGLSITYTTRKGSRELEDWVHEWGEGARGRFVPPTVVEHVCRGSDCAGRGTIALRGGTYRVTARGIVG